MGKQKANPNKIPATQADVEKAFKAGYSAGHSKAIELAWAILFMVLHDKEGFEAEDLQRIWNEVNDLSTSISKGYCKLRDLKDTLKQEVGANIV